MSEFLAKLRSRPLAVGIVALLFVTACVLVFLNIKPSRSADVGDIFYDEASGTFSRLPSSNVPPLLGKSGTESLVRAVTKDESLTPDSVLYLFRFTPEKKNSLQLSVSTNPDASYYGIFLAEVEGKEVRRLKPDSKWVPASSPEGQKIIESH